MTRIPLTDLRLRAYFALLLPAFIGHTIQLTAEDTPWLEVALRRYWITPGWHLAMPPEVPLVIAVLLGVSVLALAVRPSRATFLAVAGFYVAHYLTYPWRIRNHMTTMLGGLVVVSLVWLVARASGALAPSRVLVTGRTGASTGDAKQVDRLAVRGLALVIAVTYFYAGLHKVNTGFTDPAPDGPSAAVEGLTTFWIYGDLGSVPPEWAVWLAIWGTIVIEMVVPVVAILYPRVAIPCVLVLMIFHVPHVAVMNVADYPMIASAYYPALLSRGQARVLARHLRPSAWTLGGAALGVLTQLWFMPWWGRLTIFGIGVLAIWGWAAGAMVHATFASAAATRARTAVAALRAR